MITLEIRWIVARPLSQIGGIYDAFTGYLRGIYQAKSLRGICKAFSRPLRSIYRVFLGLVFFCILFKFLSIFLLFDISCTFCTLSPNRNGVNYVHKKTRKVFKVSSCLILAKVWSGHTTSILNIFSSFPVYPLNLSKSFCKCSFVRLKTAWLASHGKNPPLPHIMESSRPGPGAGPPRTWHGTTSISGGHYRLRRYLTSISS